MKIKKIGHCCLFVKLDNLTILTDPGMYSSEQNTLTGVDVLLITHEHADHLHIDSVNEIVKNNPQVQIVTNLSVGKKLAEVGITYSVVEGNNKIQIKGVDIEAFDGKHEELFEEYGQVQNTGYMIDNRLFYPGDSFNHPHRPVEILALPVAGPWCKIADAIHYALSVKPKKAFPVHDAMLMKDRIGSAHKIPQVYLSKNGIEFIIFNDGNEQDF